MQYTPSQLKERLVEGIDSENNVVDMPKVLEVISLLENYSITRDILEETRIGRLVNDVRRKTENKQLGKRAKDLVRKWQKVVNDGSESNTVVNGDGVKPGVIPGRLVHGLNKPPISPSLSRINKSSVSTASQLSSPNSVDSSLSRGQLSQIKSKPNTPSLSSSVNNKHVVPPVHTTKRSNSSPHLLAGSAKRPCISPVVSSKQGTPERVASPASRLSNSVVISDKHKTSSSASNTPNDSVKRTHSVQNFRSETSPGSTDLRAVQSASNLVSKSISSGQNGMVASHYNGREISTPTHSIETKGLKTTIRFNKTSPPVPPTPTPPVNGLVETPKKRGRGRPPKNRPPVDPGKANVTPQNGSVSSAKSFSEKRKVKLDIQTDIELDKFVNRTPKVKSTAELMQTLQANKSLSVSKHTARQIQDNLICKESDEEYHVPDGAKPRPHKKRNMPPSTPVSLETKTEMVERFLNSSVPHAQTEDLSPLKYELPRTESPGNASTSFEDSEGNHDARVSRQNLSTDATKTDQTDSNTVISTQDVNIANKQSEPVAGSSKEPDKQLTLEEVYSKYPPLDLDNFEFDDDTYELDEAMPVTEDDVNRIHTQHWPGVNGLYDSWGEWQDWSNTLSLTSYNSEQLHILPYVVTD